MRQCVFFCVFAENPDSPLLSRRIDDLPATGPTAVRRSSEKKRRVKMADLRTLIETRMFSKSERTLEKVGLDSTIHEKPLEQSVSKRHFKSRLVFQFPRYVCLVIVIAP